MFFKRNKNKEKNEEENVEEKKIDIEQVKEEKEPDDNAKREILNKIAEKFLNMDLCEENVNKIYDFCTTDFNGKSIKSILDITEDDKIKIEKEIEEYGIPEEEAIKKCFMDKRLNNHIAYTEIFGNSIDIYFLSAWTPNVKEAIRFLYSQLYVTHMQAYALELNNVAYKYVGISKPVAWTNNPEMIEKFIFLGEIAKVFISTKIIEQNGKMIQACYLDRELNLISNPKNSKQTIEWMRKNSMNY